MGANWSYQSAEEIWEEIRILAPNFAGITYKRIDKEGGLQWPCYDENHQGTTYLHSRLWSDQVGMKARFVPSHYQPPAEVPDQEYPLTLTTGRRLQFYNTGVQTRYYKKVKNAEEALEIHPDDAALFEFHDGEAVRVTSRRGSVVTKIRISKKQPRGLVFMSFHFPDQANTNLLTNHATDPLAGTAEFKACAVKIEKVGDDTSLSEAH